MLDREKEREPRHLFFVVIGPIGGGKTKLTDLMVKKLGLTKEEETFQDNPYLEDFYSGKEKEVSFNSQMFFLAQDALKRRRIKEALFSSSIVEDQGLEGDFILESVQRKMGWISDEDHRAYLSAFSRIVNDPSFVKPDIFIAVAAPKPVIRKRIVERAREMELKMMERHPEYFDRVVDAFNEWVSGLESSSVVVKIDTGRDDFVLERKKENWVIERIMEQTRLVW